MQSAPQYSNQRRMLQLLYMQMLLQQAQAAQAQAQRPPQPNTFDQILDYAKKAKGTYDDVNNLYNLGASAVNYFNPTYTQATQAAWNQAAGEAGQALWNAGADAATSQAGGSLGAQAGASQVGSTLAESAPWLAAAFSAYNSGKALLDKNTSDEDKAYAAAMAGPRAVASFYTLGLSNLAEGLARNKWGGTMKKLDKFNQYNPMSPVFVPMLASRFWTSDKWKTEGKRLKGLQKKGINIPDFLQGAMQLQRGRRTKDLVNPYLPKDFVGETPQYGWTNNKFATSRNVADLTGKDIWGYSAFFDKFGNDWMGKFSPQQREAIANQALNSKAVNEHHGTIDINWTPDLQAKVDAITGNRTMVPKASPQAPQPTVGVTPAPTPVTNIKKGILNRIR